MEKIRKQRKVRDKGVVHTSCPRHEGMHEAFRLLRGVFVQSPTSNYLKQSVH
jgi:hypothetical protein